MTSLDRPTPPGPFSGVALAEVAAGLHGATLDPVELVGRVLAAIERTQPVFNAFVSVDRVGALAAATAARDELARGMDRGPLHGIPVAVKDIVDTAGLTTTMGSRHFAGNVPGRDADVVARLRAAGAVIVGKTTTHEFAYGPTGDRAANGPAANPLDPSRMAGGSSAGSAAAVAAGLIPLAVGTDTGGSVRIPAALCGVAGIRPSMGRIPTGGVFPLSWSLDTVGVLAADIAGTEIGWRILASAPAQVATKAQAGYPQAGYPQRGYPQGGYPGARQPPVGQLRIGLVTGDWFERQDETVRAVVAGVVARLAGLGARLVQVPVPDAEELTELYRTVQAVEAVSIHEERLATAAELFDPEVLQRLRAAMQISAYDYARALRRLGEVRGSAAERFDGVDVLLLPTVPVLAPPLGARDIAIGGGWTSPRDALLAHTALWGVLGLPAVSVPVVAPGALPVGAQLVGPPGGDEGLLAIAGTVERAVLGYRMPGEQRRWHG